MPQLRDTPEAPDRLRPLPQARSRRFWRRASGAARRRCEAGAPWIAFVLSVTEAHNRNNVRRHPLESAEEYGAPARRDPGRPLDAAEPRHVVRLPVRGSGARGRHDRAARPPDPDAPGRRGLPVRHDGARRSRPCGEPVSRLHGRGFPRPTPGRSMRTTPTASGSPMSTPPTGRACACSMLRSAAWAAVRSRPAPPATSRPRTWSGCSSAWELRPASISTSSFPSPARPRGCPAAAGRPRARRAHGAARGLRAGHVGSSSLALTAPMRTALASEARKHASIDAPCR